jgi:hypothetical protein
MFEIEIWNCFYEDKEQYLIILKCNFIFLESVVYDMMMRLPAHTKPESGMLVSLCLHAARQATVCQSPSATLHAPSRDHDSSFAIGSKLGITEHCSAEAIRPRAKS